MNEAKIPDSPDSAARGSSSANGSAHSREFQGRGTGKRTLPNCDCGRILRRGVVCEKCGCAHCYKCTLTIKGHKLCVLCAPNAGAQPRGN